MLTTARSAVAVAVRWRRPSLGPIVTVEPAQLSGGGSAESFSSAQFRCPLPVPAAGRGAADGKRMARAGVSRLSGGILAVLPLPAELLGCFGRPGGDRGRPGARGQQPGSLHFTHAHHALRTTSTRYCIFVPSSHTPQSSPRKRAHTHTHRPQRRVGVK